MTVGLPASTRWPRPPEGCLSPYLQESAVATACRPEEGCQVSDLAILPVGVHVITSGIYLVPFSLGDQEVLHRELLGYLVEAADDTHLVGVTTDVGYEDDHVVVLVFLELLPFVPGHGERTLLPT